MTSQRRRYMLTVNQTGRVCQSFGIASLKSLRTCRCMIDFNAEWKRHEVSSTPSATHLRSSQRAGTPGNAHPYDRYRAGAPSGRHQSRTWGHGPRWTEFVRQNDQAPPYCSFASSAMLTSEPGLVDVSWPLLTARVLILPVDLSGPGVAPTATVRALGSAGANRLA